MIIYEQKQHYQIRNWREYNRALVQRGSLTLWFILYLIIARHPACSVHRRGGRAVVSPRPKRPARAGLYLLRWGDPVPLGHQAGLSSAVAGPERAGGIAGPTAGSGPHGTELQSGVPAATAARGGHPALAVSGRRPPRGGGFDRPY